MCMSVDYDNFKLRIEDKLKDFCWVNHHNKLIFFVIPKNASTAIRESPLMKDSYRTTFSLLQDEVDLDKYTTFTVLREPIERFVSAYYEVLRGHRHGNIYDTIADKDFVYIRREPDRFLYFLREVYRNGFFDTHLKPQFHFLSDNNKEIIMDHYLFFDNIAEDYSNFCKLYDISYDLPNKNYFIKNQKLILLEFIMSNKNILNIVKKIYKRDIMLYDEKNNIIK